MRLYKIIMNTLLYIGIGLITFGFLSFVLCVCMETYMIRLHHVKKVDLSGSRVDKIKLIKEGNWKINEELKSWALENASDEQINKWYKDCHPKYY